MQGAEALFQIAELVVRELALFAAVGFLVGGIDDLAVDLIWLFRRCRDFLKRRDIGPLQLSALPPPREPGRLAIFVPAWDEAEVIASMLTLAVRHLKEQDYRLFVGAYPNDPETVAAIETVAAHTAHIRLVLCQRAGPTTKADCLNHLWRAVEDDERQSGTRFKAVILHDAEDIVHGCEIALFDRLIEDRSLVQIPVTPLVHEKSRWASGHYCDEFAETHGKDLVVRNMLGAGVPSAGVGSAISRDMLGEIAAERGGMPFDSESLTEDYELGLNIAERGGRSLFARVYDQDELIAVEAYFPATIETSVRQKTRWITGIALAGWDRLGWRGGLAERWMRLRDRRAILSAIILFAAYATLILGFLLLVAAWFGGHALSPLTPAVRLLLAVNFGLLCWRLAIRALFTGYGYGWREGLRAIPRAIVSNIIAMMAARRAMMRYLTTRPGAEPRWDKTRHIFPERPVF